MSTVVLQLDVHALYIIVAQGYRAWTLWACCTRHAQPYGNEAINETTATLGTIFTSRQPIAEEHALGTFSI